MTPDVSIVVPSYARPGETRRAVRSALEQRGLAVEVVVVDDASPSPLELPPPLIESGQVRLVRMAENGGPAAARNRGVIEARAEVIGFLDSDDFFVPNSLKARFDALREPTQSDQPTLVCSGVWRWIPGRAATRSMPVPASDIDRLASGCWYFPGSTALMSRRSFEAVGPLDDGLRRLEDLDWGIRLGQRDGRLVIAPVVGAVIRRSPAAALATVAAAADRMLPRLQRDLPPSALRRAKAYLALERASSHYGAGEIAPFLGEMLRSWQHVPRMRLHLESWWQEQPASAEELAGIEALAARLAEPAPDAPISLTAQS